MHLRYRNYLKTHRRQWCLSQEELAQLMGRGHRTVVSRIESGERSPTYRDLLSLEVIFGVSPSAFFPTSYEEVEEQVMRRAAALSVKLERRTSKAAGVKRNLLRAMISRARSSANV